MVDEVVVTSHTSWGDRIKNSCASLIFSPILFIGAIVLLVWNEGNSVKQYKAYSEGMDIVHKNIGTTSVNATLDGKLVHLSGIAETDSQVFDPIFGVGTTDTQISDHFLMIQRNVEMYQWTEQQSSETKKNVGGSTTTETTFTYSKQWKGYHVNSVAFLEDDDHVNPDKMLYDDAEFVAGDIRVGALQLSDKIVSKMRWWESLPSTALVGTKSIPDQTTANTASLSGDTYYFGTGNPSAPKVGDTRVNFEAVPSQIISVVAKQTNSGLSTYASGSTGKSILLVEKGAYGATEMFERAIDGLTLQTWLLRFVGFLLIYGSFYILFKPLSVVADVVPFVGNLIEKGNCFLSTVFSMVITTIVIAIAWIAYRPLLLLIPLAAVLLGFAWFCIKKRAQGEQDESEEKFEDNAENGEEGHDVADSDDISVEEYKP